ncbi:hypothetical protein L3X38_025975 [Prunus dulcis]|uniref:Uncharacterized protein n=1 Tax=Prunus dulcis TaxID=3755 RepID=A0AAD4Z7W9_PRUDU|nr:hypothetical protein L3X38_025975 [Prunus dulcis]
MKGALNIVEDAVGSHVAWPEDLVVFIDDIVFTDSMIMVNNYLYKLVKDQEWERMIAFMDPSRTTNDPMSPDEAGRVQYIVKALKQASIDSIFLIPYNPGVIGSLQSLTKREKMCISWILLGFVTLMMCGNYARSGKKKVFYTQMELDEVRDEWACHVLEWI